MIPIARVSYCKAACRFFAAVFIVVLAHSDCSAQYRPSLYFREDWAESPPATPVTQQHVANDALVLGLYGPAADSIRKSNHERPADDPFYVWSGLCTDNWAVSLKKSDSYVDLSEYAKVVWRSKQSGMRNLRLILKLADGTWLVSDAYDGSSSDWRVHQFNIADIAWYALDISTMVEGRPVVDPDLTRVEEIGFTDLMRGGGTPASSRLDWIEVYGRAVSK